MATNLQIGETVYVPAARIGLGQSASSALVQVTVQARNDRTVSVSCAKLANPVQIATSAVHRDAGILLIRIGDLQTEPALLDPLAKSLLHFCRILVPDDMLFFWEIRTKDELQTLWTQYHSIISHVVLVAHGATDGVTFATSGLCSADDLVEPFTAANVNPKSFISLCCKTGHAGFSKIFSQASASICRNLIAPFQSIHGAIASQFTQTFFAYHFLEGQSLAVAFRNAREAVPGASKFRLWRSGDLK
jgi:hypothetical protein